MEFRKMVTEEFIYREQWRNRHTEQTYGYGEREGEGGMYGKSNMETYITICNTDSQQKFAIWLRKIKLGLCIKLEEWYGEGDRREFHKGGDISIPMADSC